MSVLEVNDAPPPDAERATQSRGRRASSIPIPIPQSTLLSSLANHLPSAPLTKLSSFLPQRPPPFPKQTSFNSDVSSSDIEFGDEDSVDVEMDLSLSPQSGPRRAVRAKRSLWQRLDLGDGRGERLLLVNINPSADFVVQIWDCSNACASDSASVAQGRSRSTANRDAEADMDPSPEEMACFKRLPGSEVGQMMRLYDTGDRMGWHSSEGTEVIVDGKIFRGEIEGRKRNLLGVLAITEPSGITDGTAFLVIVDLADGTVMRKIEVGKGWSGEVLASQRVIVVTLSCSSSPSIHFISPSTFQSSSQPLIDHIAVNPRTGRPVVSLSGRIFSYVTKESRPIRSDVSTTAERDYGTIVTKYSAQRHHTVRERRKQSASEQSLAAVKSVQTAVLNTAASISVEVGKGVWSGLKGLGSAALVSARGSGMLSKSAPVESGIGNDNRESHLTPRHVQGGFPQAMSSPTSPGQRARKTGRTEEEEMVARGGGRWIKVLDLCPRGKQSSNRRKNKTLIAHFALPDQRSSARTPPTVVRVSLSPLGTSLCAFTRGGRTGIVVELRPTSSSAVGTGTQGVLGEVWARFDLKRGVTPAEVANVQWDRGGRWIGVGTAHTIHVFAIRPEGGKPDLAGHLLARNINSLDLQPLSVRLAPSRRLRPNSDHIAPDHVPASPRMGLLGGVAAGHEPHVAPVFCFGRSTTEIESIVGSSLQKGSQEMLVYQPNVHALEGCKLFVYPKGGLETAEATAAMAENRGPRRTKSSDNGIKSGNGTNRGLGVASVVTAKWSLQVLDGYRSSGAADGFALTTVGEKRGSNGSESPLPRKRNFAAAELETYSSSPRMVPGTIYKDHSVTFRSLPDSTDQPISFRKDVLVAVATSQEDDSDEPLLNALQSHLNIEQSHAVLPALPNGRGHQSWQPSKVVYSTAKDMVRFTRKQPQVSAGGEKESGFALVGEQISIDEENGFLYDTGGELEDMTNGSSADETRDEDWQDDLAAGLMDMDDEVPSGEQKAVNDVERL